MALVLDKMEHEVLKYWDDNHTFEQSLSNRQGCDPFVLYEGPPTANGKPGIHHVLTRTFKDMIARFQTMSGRLVERKAGWDEHGLPVEIEVQKELKFHNKKQIEAFGVGEFNAKCAASTQKYIGDWEKLTHRMGYWLDFKNAYRTSDSKYIQRVWEVLEKMWNAGLIYQSYKVVPWACDSGTVVSNAEVAQGYKEVTHISAYVLFKLCDDMNWVLAWTTTPWTLPGNMALAVNPNLIYNVYQCKNKRIFSLEPCGDKVGEVSGKDLVEQEYYHPFTHEHCVIYGTDFVKAEKTGIVHIAPAFGEDDYALWQKQMKDFPSSASIVCHVDPDGHFNNQSPEWLQGNVLADNFNAANSKVLDFLDSDETLFRAEQYTHQYPHNWRTGKPLIYYLRTSWYVNVNKLREAIVEANEKVNWHPSHIKHGRFGDWLKGDVDWSISRERFWGTPLPFYKHDQDPFLSEGWRSDALNYRVISPDFPHKPEADADFASWKRTPEVLDCWFDSGAMPFAAFDEYQQADCICEAIDQVRGWFYSLLVIGVAMKNEAPYKNVLCLGHILDKDSQKMAKSKSNVVDPWKMFEKYGADSVRWYMVRNPLGNSLVFDENDLKFISHTFLNRIWNCFAFFELYKNIEKPDIWQISEGNHAHSYRNTWDKLQPIDRWVLTQLAILTNITHVCYEGYRFAEATVEIEKFVDLLSNVWIRANRSRFWNTDGNGIDEAAFYVLHRCLTTLCKIVAPIMPFISEYMWGKLEEGSVHLQNYPRGSNIHPDDELLVQEMSKALKVVSDGNNCRNEAGIKVRQILQAVYVPTQYKLHNFERFVKDELNVREIIYSSQNEVSLNVTLSDDLLSEGLARDFVRAIQVLRKEMGLQVTDKIELVLDYRGNDEFKRFIEGRQEDCAKKLLVSNWVEKEAQKILKVREYIIGVEINKV